MPASPSRLRLNAYYLKEISYYLRDDLEKLPGKKTDDKTVDLEISDLTTPIEGEGREWRCEVTIKSVSPEKQHFYDFRIVMVGFFSVDEGVDPETAIRLALTNCPAVLYSTSREIIATVTRRSPYPGTLLPTVTFVEEQAQAEQKKDPKIRKPRKRKAA